MILTGLRMREARAMWKRLIWFLAAATVSVSGTASAQVAADVPPFSADEIAIYRDFLLHYLGPLSQMIGLEDTTVTFTASRAFGDEPNPPNMEIPAYTGRRLPPEVMALTEEKAVTARITAAGKLVNPDKIIPALCGCKGGQGGTVVYQLKHGHWKMKKPVLNDWIG
jgi:hypothetical protein